MSMQEAAEKITYQGVAPWMIPVFILVGIVLCVAFAAVWKVVEISRGEKKRKHDEMTAIAEGVVQAKVNTLAEDISQKVAANMQKKFEEIDRKLDTDKRRLEQAEKRSDAHDKALERIEATLESVDANVKDMHEGFTCMTRGTIATINQLLHNGNQEELESAANELNRYLTSRPIVPMQQGRRETK